MEVTALCVRLLSRVSPVMTVLFLLIGQPDFTYSQKADVDFPQVVPNRQQHFEYESIEISCEGLQGLTGWRVMKKNRGVVKSCAPDWSSTGPCKIRAAQAFDSGEYWCDMGAKRSNTVNITVTVGSVILESPVHPVTEGDAVTLRCRQKQTSSNLTAKFFKDGYLMERNATGDLTIQSVSTSHEGFYRCSISGGGESPQSWLTVRAAHKESDNSSEPSVPDSPQVYLLLCIGLGVFLVVLLLVVGLLLCWRHQTTIRGTATYTSVSPQTANTATYATVQFSSPPQSANRTTSSSVQSPQSETMYAVITKSKKEKDQDEFLHAPVYHTLSLENI